ncbi:hypothetical protein [Leptospira kirschneri]|uniref:hypothetical protein n=1 Tax=Leptospira kirschneri TaxID=29507 RepID=UPI000519AD0A|nr:hypothetical protein [Leptospira kirschneri]
MLLKLFVLLCIIFGITISSCIGCSNSNEQPIPIRTLSVPKNLETKCKLPAINIRSFNKTPNADQKLNERSGTRITTATINCENFQINIIAQFDSTATEDELLIINYGKKPIELVHNRGDFAGGGYLNFLGVDDRFVYYSITGAKLIPDDLVLTYYCFNWKTGEEHFLDTDACNTFQ